MPRRRPAPENFPISNFLSIFIALNNDENYRTSKGLAFDERGGGPRGKGRETLFRNRLSRTKGMTPALCFECRSSVRTSRRFLGSLDFNGQASLPRSKGGCRTFDAVLPRTEERQLCDKMENSSSIVVQTCKIIRHSLSRSRGSIRAANYTLLSRDIKTRRKREKRERKRERRAHDPLVFPADVSISTDEDL